MKCMRIHARSRMTATSLLPATGSSPQLPPLPSPGGSILVSTSFDMKNYVSAPHSWSIISLWQHLSRWWDSHELWFLFTHSFCTSSVASPLQSSLSSCWSCIGSLSPFSRHRWAIFTSRRWLHVLFLPLLLRSRQPPQPAPPSTQDAPPPGQSLQTTAPWTHPHGEWWSKSTLISHPNLI